MVSIFFWIVGIIVVFFFGVVLYLKKAPHGWIQARTGLVLKFFPSLDSQPVVQLRNSLEEFVKKQRTKILKSLPVDQVRDVQIPTRHGSIGARIYDQGIVTASHKIIFIHGGGWCVGSINTYDEQCRQLTRVTNLPVISLNYSLAPEHKFPHAHEECLDAVEWIIRNSKDLGLSNSPNILIGDSAGGNLIISTCYNLKDELVAEIDKIIPVYPVTDSLSKDYYSSKNYGHGYYLTNKAMSQFTEGLISNESDLQDIRLSPINYNADQSFPDMFLITAEYDPLRDQGEAFARKLKSEGRLVTAKRYKGTIHAFFGLKDFGSQGINAIHDINRYIRGESLKNVLDLT